MPKRKKRKPGPGEPQRLLPSPPCSARRGGKRPRSGKARLLQRVKEHRRKQQEERQLQELLAAAAKGEDEEDYVEDDVGEESNKSNETHSEVEMNQSDTADGASSDADDDDDDGDGGAGDGDGAGGATSGVNEEADADDGVAVVVEDDDDNDDDDVEDAEEGDQAGTTPATTEDVSLADASDLSVWHDAEAECLYVGLEEGKSMVMVGSGSMEVLRGRANALGYQIEQGSDAVTVDSPLWAAAMVVTACSAPNMENAAGAGPSTALPLPDDSPMTDCHTLLRLSPRPESLPRILSAHDDAEAHPSWQGMTGLRVMTPEAAAARGINVLRIPSHWENAATQVVSMCEDVCKSIRRDVSDSRGPAVAVCGGKGVGKSTLARYIVHRILVDARQRQPMCGDAGGMTDEEEKEGTDGPAVAFLDCDLGQPELTPPGLVSLSVVRTPLLGPPHTHMQTPEVSYFLGDVVPKCEPGLYTAYLSQLVERFRSESRFRGVPLIVNCDGWVKGLGIELLNAFLGFLQPDVVLKLEGKHAASRFALTSAPRLVIPLPPGHEPPPQSKGGSSGRGVASAVNLRILRLLAYFLANDIEAWKDLQARQRTAAVVDPQGTIARALAWQKPVCVPWRGVQLRVMHEEVAPSETLRSINLSFVGLLQGPATEHDAGAAGAEDPSSSVSEVAGPDGLRVLTQTPVYACAGVGLVRSVDRARRRLYVLTPVPLQTLQTCKVLARGAVQVPLVMFYDPRAIGVPYVVHESTDADGALQLRARTGIARRRFSGSNAQAATRAAEGGV